MKGQLFSAFLVISLLISTLGLASNTRSGKAEGGTIYIRADGSIDPPTTPILTSDNVIYTFTDNINDSIVIERDNIVLDGAGYTVQGTGVYPYKAIDLTSRSNVTIKNANVKSFYYGIYLYSSSYNSISGNNITNNQQHGIGLESSSYNSISGNNITANNYLGIWLYSSSNNNSISGNNIANNGYGIYLYWYSNNNSISGNNITANNEVGIRLEFSSDNSISGNVFVENGMIVWDSYGNVVVDNIVNGKPLVYLEGVSDRVVEEAGQVILVGCSNVTVENLDLSSASIGVQLCKTGNTRIAGNNITNNQQYGIGLDYSSGNSIIGNNITNNGDGIYLHWYSNNNSISGNNITANNRDGIRPEVSSNNNSISGNNIANNLVGIGLDYSSGNSIIGNNITNNQQVGIVLSRSSNYNSISGNNIAKNQYGIGLLKSSGNSIYHNNFINNTQQVYSSESTNVWDNGYPSGGNYWSDYNGTDLCSGPYQNETGSDGMVDMPFMLDSNNTDQYPLTKPYSPHDVGLRLSFSKTIVAKGYNITLSINATILNYDLQTQTSNFSYAMPGASFNEEVTISQRNSTTFNFQLNTTNLSYGSYYVQASISPVPNETDPSDNNLTYYIRIVVPGDVSSANQGVPDGTVNMRDIQYMILLFNTKPNSINWNPNADVNNDQVVNMRDIQIAILNFNKHE